MQKLRAGDPMIGETIVLVHVTTGERRVVYVESVARTYLSIRWGQAGIYDLNLAANVLTPRSCQTQAKGKAKWYKKDKPLWKAEDIHAVRKMVEVEMRGEDLAELTRVAMAKHEASMPEGKPGIRVVDTYSSEEVATAPIAMRPYLMGSKRVVKAEQK
jgi:hypothetical protein